MRRSSPGTSPSSSPRDAKKGLGGNPLCPQALLLSLLASESCASFDPILSCPARRAYSKFQSLKSNFNPACRTPPVRVSIVPQPTWQYYCPSGPEFVRDFFGRCCSLWTISVSRMFMQIGCGSCKSNGRIDGPFPVFRAISPPGVDMLETRNEK
jgi:hypothetical protein